ncbi:unnamed protein product, partial [Rotaria sordida]
MEMKDELGSEKVAMMGNTYSQATKSLTLAEDPEALCLISTTLGIIDTARNSTGRSYIIVSLISFIINGLGFWATYKYNTTGLRV